MSKNLTPEQHQIVRTTHNRIDAVNAALTLTEEYPGTDYRVAAVILLCRRQLVQECNTLIESFGSDWPESEQ